jgi:hypothetical protein
MAGSQPVRLRQSGSSASRVPKLLPFVGLGFGFLVVLALGSLARKWHAPEEHPSNRMPPYWVWGESWWRGVRRGRLPARIGGLFIAAAAVFSSLAPYLGLAVLVFSLPLMATTFLFNWPKAVVPPPFRQERGVLKESLSDRGSRLTK